MRKRHTIIYLISVFILAQIAWFSLLGLWIYWYVSNYIIFTEVGEYTITLIVSDGKEQSLAKRQIEVVEINGSIIIEAEHSLTVEIQYVFVGDNLDWDVDNILVPEPAVESNQTL